MASVVQICNLALSHIAKEGIRSISEESAEARVCRLHYDIARDIMLAAYDWSFATVIASLAGLENDWSERYFFKFQKPIDCLKIIRVVPPIDPQWDNQPIAHEVRGSGIYTNISPCTLEYVAQRTDAQSFTMPFVDALSWALAARISMPLVTDPNVRAKTEELARVAFTAATAQDANNEPTRPDYVPGHIAARA